MLSSLMAFLSTSSVDFMHHGPKVPLACILESTCGPLCHSLGLVLLCATLRRAHGALLTVLMLFPALILALCPTFICGIT